MLSQRRLPGSDAAQHQSPAPQPALIRRPALLAALHDDRGAVGRRLRTPGTHTRLQRVGQPVVVAVTGHHDPRRSGHVTGRAQPRERRSARARPDAQHHQVVRLRRTRVVLQRSGTRRIEQPSAVRRRDVPGHPVALRAGLQQVVAGRQPVTRRDRHELAALPRRRQSVRRQCSRRPQHVDGTPRAEQPVERRRHVLRDVREEHPAHTRQRAPGPRRRPLDAVAPVEQQDVVDQGGGRSPRCPERDSSRARRTGTTRLRPAPCAAGAEQDDLHPVDRSHCMRETR